MHLGYFAFGRMNFLTSREDERTQVLGAVRAADVVCP